MHYSVLSMNIKDGYERFDDFDAAKEYALKLSEKKGVAVLSGFGDAFTPEEDERFELHFIEGKQFEPPMSWPEFKSIAREFYK